MHPCAIMDYEVKIELNWEQNKAEQEETGEGKRGSSGRQANSLYGFIGSKRICLKDMTSLFFP